MAAACARTEDQWGAETCSAAPKTGASTYVGFYWAKKALRTRVPATELKNRMTWTMYEVSPGVYKFKNVMRQMWLGIEMGVRLTLAPDFAGGASIRLDEAPAPNAEVFKDERYVAPPYERCPARGMSV